MFFDVKCKDYNGLFLTYAYIGNSLTELSNNDCLCRLEQSEMISCVFDTGANCTSISKDIIRKINAKPISEIDTITSTNGVSFSPKYMVDICLPGHTLFRNCKVNTFNGPIGILIGMDIICNGSLLFYHHNGDNYLRFSEEEP